MAQPYVNVAGFCESVLANMRQYQAPNYALDMGKMTGMLDWITSDLNGGVKSELISTANGEKLRQARVVYKQPTVDCEVLTGSDALDARICDDGVEDDENSVNVAIDRRIASRVRQFSYAKLMNICQDAGSFINEYLMSDMRALREQLSKQLIIVVDTDAGINNRHNGSQIAADTAKSLDLIGSSTDTSQPVPLLGNFVDFTLDYQNNQFRGFPTLIGEGNLQRYFTLANLSCCNAAVPLEAARVNSGVAFFLDQNTNEAIGQDQVLMLAPGATHLLWFNSNQGLNINNELEAHLVVPDPVNPRLTWDWDFFWDKCAGRDRKGAFKYQISAYWDVFNTFQSDAFKSSTSPTVSPACSDIKSGVTGIFKYVIN